MLTVAPAVCRFFSRLFGVVTTAPTTIEISKNSQLPCQILEFVHFLVLLPLYSCVSGHCDIWIKLESYEI